MAVVGRKPKDADKRVNRHAPRHDWTEVPNVPFADGPKLPSRRTQNRSWPAMTKRWWTTLSQMPHCVLWSESDWSFALDTALIAAAFHDGELQRAAELRNREKLLGVTVEHRRDLRIRYVDPPSDDDTETTPGAVTRMDDYRDVLAD